MMLPLKSCRAADLKSIQIKGTQVNGDEEKGREKKKKEKKIEKYEKAKWNYFFPIKGLACYFQQ